MKTVVEYTYSSIIVDLTEREAKALLGDVPSKQGNICTIPSAEVCKALNSISKEVKLVGMEKRGKKVVVKVLIDFDNFLRLQEMRKKICNKLEALIEKN